jgi:hypothetical protein
MMMKLNKTDQSRMVPMYLPFPDAVPHGVWNWRCANNGTDEDDITGASSHCALCVDDTDRQPSLAWLEELKRGSSTQ